ncbi:hypothetical protein D1872_212710 [compost metagenome]
MLPRPFQQQGFRLDTPQEIFALHHFLPLVFTELEHFLVDLIDRVAARIEHIPDLNTVEQDLGAHLRPGRQEPGIRISRSRAGFFGLIRYADSDPVPRHQNIAAGFEKVVGQGQHFVLVIQLVQPFVLLRLLRHQLVLVQNAFVPHVILRKLILYFLKILRQDHVLGIFLADERILLDHLLRQRHVSRDSATLLDPEYLNGVLGRLVRIVQHDKRDYDDRDAEQQSEYFFEQLFVRGDAFYCT